jgi:hypothetical protein
MTRTEIKVPVAGTDAVFPATVGKKVGWTKSKIKEIGRAHV